MTTQTDTFRFLTDSVSINNKILWNNNSYKIPIGFSFTFAGATFDTLTIKTDGTITFDPLSKYNFVAFFKKFSSDADSLNQSVSPLSYSLTRLSDSSKILKIEFKNVSFIPDSSSSISKVYLNFQIWLNQQSNAIELHMGTSDDYISSETYLIGLINMYDPGENPLGFLLQGVSSAPSGTQIPAAGDLVRITDKPVSGTIYKFITN